MTRLDLSVCAWPCMVVFERAKSIEKYNPPIFKRKAGRNIPSAPASAAFANNAQFWLPSTFFSFLHHSYYIGDQRSLHLAACRRRFSLSLVRAKQRRTVHRLRASGDIEDRTRLPKVVGLERHHERLDRHHGEVLDTRVVREAKDGPHHHVLVDGALLACAVRRKSALLAVGLVGVLAARPQLVVAVLGHPHVVSCKLGARICHRVRVRQQQLRRRHVHLVSDRLLRDGVDLVRVGDLERAVLHGCQIRSALVRQHGLLHRVAHAVRVRQLVGLRAERHGHAVFVVHRVAVAVDARVDTHAEDVLVVGAQHTARHYVAVRRRLARIDGRHGQHTRGTHLERDRSRLVKVPQEDVLVVGHRDDGLQHERAATHHVRIVGSVVGVLHAQAVVDLVHAHHLLLLKQLAVGQRKVAVKVVDRTQAVAPQTEAVGSKAARGITHIERLLAVQRRTRIAVRYRHLGHRQSVEDGSTLESKVVQRQTFPRSPADAEVPSLPLDVLAAHRERRTLGLLHDQRLETRSRLKVGLEMRHVLALFHVGLRPSLLPGVHHAVGRVARVAPVDMGDLARQHVDNGHKRQRPRVVERVTIVSRARRLEDPRIGSDGRVGLQTELLERLVNQRILHHRLFELLELCNVEVGAVGSRHDRVRLDASRSYVDYSFVDLGRLGLNVDRLELARQWRRILAGVVGIEPREAEPPCEVPVAEST
ncbi:hypothetical protein L1887_57886 [Cichorium endivia]|nr:hypothetical protein L1887_57886 [Cichorium endivia]